MSDDFNSEVCYASEVLQGQSEVLHSKMKRPCGAVKYLALTNFEGDKMEQKVYIVDFTTVNYYIDVHTVIKESLDFPDYYGCNWDAFWDCLTDMYGEKMHIKIIGLEVVKRKFDDTADQFIDILKEFKHNKYFENDITIEIIDQNGKSIIVQ